MYHDGGSFFKFVDVGCLYDYSSLKDDGLSLKPRLRAVTGGNGAAARYCVGFSGDDWSGLGSSGAYID